MKQRIYRLALALLSIGFVCQSAVAGALPIACKILGNGLNNFDPGSPGFQVTNRCVSTVCITQHVKTTETIPAGAKIVVKAFGSANHKAHIFTLNKPLAPYESVTFGRRQQGTSCKATATW